MKYSFFDNKQYKRWLCPALDCLCIFPKFMETLWGPPWVSTKIMQIARFQYKAEKQNIHFIISFYIFHSFTHIRLECEITLEEVYY